MSYGTGKLSKTPLRSFIRVLDIVFLNCPKIDQLLQSCYNCVTFYFFRTLARFCTCKKNVKNCKKFVNEIVKNKSSIRLTAKR